MDNNKWFKKRLISDYTLSNVGVDPLLWSVVAAKVHESAIADISVFLGTDVNTMTSMLLEVCDKPTGSCKGLN